MKLSVFPKISLLASQVVLALHISVVFLGRAMAVIVLVALTIVVIVNFSLFSIWITRRIAP